MDGLEFWLGVALVLGIVALIYVAVTTLFYFDRGDEDE